MGELRRLSIAALGILLSALSLSAHHAFGSEFDEAKIVQFRGSVQLIAWMNPHGLIFVDSRNDKGETEHWALETLTSTQLGTFGLSKGSLKVGDLIEVCGYATKDGIDPLKSYQAPDSISLSLKSIPRPVLTGKLTWPKTLSYPTARS
jgi:hypothetical protein